MSIIKEGEEARKQNYPNSEDSTNDKLHEEMQTNDQETKDTREQCNSLFLADLAINKHEKSK